MDVFDVLFFVHQTPIVHPSHSQEHFACSMNTTLKSGFI